MAVTLRSIAAVLAAAILGGCAAASPVAPWARTPAADVRAATGEQLVVGFTIGEESFGVAQFDVSSGALVRTLSTGICYVRGVATDSARNVYAFAQRCNEDGGNVTEFPPSAARASRVVYPRCSNAPCRPDSMAVDANGNLYVGATSTAIFSYGRQGSTAIRKIQAGVQSPVSMAFDAAGNLYAANCERCPATGPASITEYAPQGTQPKRTITRGIGLPSVLATDRTGRLYVLGANAVAVYDPERTAPRYTIGAGLHHPVSIALDRFSNLYVANSTSRTVTVYAFGSPKVKRVITARGAPPVGVAVDRSGAMFVATPKGVTEFAPGSGRVVQTFAAEYATSLAIVP